MNNGEPTYKTTPPEIAIIEANTLTGLGLKQLLEEILPTAVVRLFRSFAALTDDTPDMYAHYFVSAQVYFEHTAFFRERGPKCIVLTGSAAAPSLQGVTTLNIYQEEQELAKSILRLHSHGHNHGHQYGQPHGHPRADVSRPELSPREAEVLVLLAHGLINKEIADRLHISLTTVISHRKNITEKLGIKSLSGLTIYAVMNGYVEADRI